MKEYASHTKCVSEAEKYGGGDWKAPSNFNKGEKKQQAWVDTVNETLKNAGAKLNPPSRSLLQTLAKHDNVPRKKPKFLVSLQFTECQIIGSIMYIKLISILSFSQNFINNVARNRFDSNTLENVWNLLEEQWKSQVVVNKKSATVANGSHKEEVKNVMDKIDEVESVDVPATEDGVANHKKKKRKKNKDPEGIVDVPAVENGENLDFTTTHKKKKRKKNKEQVEIVELAPENEVVHKKKKRRNKTEEIETVENMAKATPIIDDDVAIHKKKKRKKNKSD